MRSLSLAVAGAASLAVSSAVAGPTPILRYTFDDASNPTANSGSLGAAYDGAVGSGVSFVAFNGGLAIEKDAPIDAQVVPLGDENAFDLGDSDFTARVTVATTFKDHAAPGVRFIITKNATASNDNWGIAFQPTTGRVYFGIAANGQDVALISCDTINDGQPHELMGVRSGDRMGLYIDGVLQAAGPVPAGFPATSDENTETLRIAGRDAAVGPTGGVNDEFVGIIDDVEVYDVALVVPGTASVADLAPSYGVFDFSDVFAFLNAFGSSDAAADIAEPFGVWDFSDVFAFLTAFGAGCS